LKLGNHSSRSSTISTHLFYSHELERLGGSTDNLTKEQAREILLKCIRVCYLRDCRATNKYHLATITSEGSEVEEPALIDSNWEVARGIVGYD